MAKKKNNLVIHIPILIGAAVLLFALPAAAQLDRATLSGSITDPSGAGLAGARVTAANSETGLSREVIVADSGYYVIPQLPIGSYTVTITAAGFKGVRFERIDLQVGQTRTLDARLEVAPVATQVEVMAEVPPLDRTSAELGSVIESKQIANLPVNGRHWASLMLLAPGAVNTGAGTQDSTRFVGRANDDNNWTFDGVDNTAIKDPTYGANVRLVVSMDSIAEFKVSSSMYSAESGNGAGGQISLVSKSGSNDFHGGVFEYLRNSALDARTVFDGPTLPPFRLNQFGGNFGGPIVKSKLFFFVNYEGLRQRQGSTYTSQVPSALLRSQVMATSPALKLVLDAYPAGTSPTKDPLVDDFTANFSKKSNENSGTWRLDWNLSEKTTMFFRHSIDSGLNETPTGMRPEYHTEDSNQPQNYVLQLQRTFSPTVVNEVRLGINRLPAIIDEIGPFPTTFNIPSLTTQTDTRVSKEIGTTYSILDNFSLFRGRHSLKIGGEIRFIHMDNEVGPVNSATYSSMANFISNKADALGVSPGVPMLGGRRNFYFAYIQDDFKLFPNLTLNLGARYEYYTVLGEQYNRMAPFDEINGVFLPASAGPYEPDYNNLAPRVSMAWAPKVFKDKTVIRTGFGIFYGPGQNDDVFGPIESIEESSSLSTADVPAGLSWPIDPWLSQMKSSGRTPRHLKRNRRDEYSQQWGLNIQQQLPAAFVMQVGYSGNNAHKILSRSYINLINPATGKRPWSSFGRIDSRRDDANGNFDAMQVSLKRRLAGGVQGGFEYMWSHALNDGAIGGGESTAPQNVNDRHAEKSNSNYDIRHSMTGNFVWELPIGPGKRFLQSGFGAAVLGGWEMSGIVSARTGRVLNIAVTRSSSALPDGNSSNQRPDLVPGIPIYPDNQTLGNWLNMAAYAVPAKGKWGTLGKNTARGPGVHQWDIALQKKAKITEGQTVSFRAEFFNIFNRPHFANPGTNISSPSSFGRITAPMNREIGTGTARQIQFMLRYAF
ncbi:MAG TPA: TonB-dependent receptor [Acidobacteriota bacterium]|nr:TonB-dependent receptor [Acidobacteriota bacterium]